MQPKATRLICSGRCKEVIGAGGLVGRLLPPNEKHEIHDVIIFRALLIATKFGGTLIHMRNICLSRFCISVCRNGVTRFGFRNKYMALI